MEPPDTSSPQATLNSFLQYTDRLYEAITAEKENKTEINEYFQRAAGCLDLSKMPPDLVNIQKIEAVLRLREIIDRINMPQISSVPDLQAVHNQNLTSWRIPHTEIYIVAVDKSPHPDKFLFSSATIKRLENFYNEVKHLPIKKAGRRDLFHEYIISSGWMIPDYFLSRLPDWMWQEYFEQTLWQWIGLFLFILLGITTAIPFVIFHRRLQTLKDNRSKLIRLLLPIAGISICFVFKYFICKQIRITGNILIYLSVILDFLVFTLTAWGILILGDTVIYKIINSKHIKEDALDADVIKLVGRLISLCLVFSLSFQAGEELGFSVTALFASAGIAGVAVALAAQETLANFFGGISIFLDRPFRAGDFISIASKERTLVKSIGMRSTRLLTLDGTTISIPNSILNNTEINNLGSPGTSLRISININVSYKTDLEFIENLIVKIASDNDFVVDNPIPCIRIKSLGDYAIHYQLQAWIQDHQKINYIRHSLQRTICDSFKNNGIKFSIPTQDIFLQTQDHKIKTNLQKKFYKKTYTLFKNKKRR